MNLKDAFEAVPLPSRSKLDGFRALMTADDITALNAALSSPLTHMDIARVLTAQGYPIGEASIRRERERLNTQITGL